MIIINTPPRPPAWVRFKDYLIILLALFAIIYGFRECSKRKTWEQKVVEKEEARKKSIDSANKALKEHILNSNNSIVQWQNIADANEAEATVLKYERDQAWKGLYTSKNVADSLSKRVQLQRGKDTTDCLELAKKYDKASSDIWWYRTNTDDLIEKYVATNAFKDSIISEERELKKHALEAGLQTAEAYSALHASFKRLSPHNSVWAGFETTFSPGAILAGPTVAFQTKKGTQYQIGIGLDSKDVQYYVSGKILWKISFRNK